MENPARYSVDQSENYELFREIHCFMMSMKFMLFAMRRDDECNVLDGLLTWLKGRNIHDISPTQASVMFCITQIHYLMFRLIEILDSSMNMGYRAKGMLGTTSGEPGQWIDNLHNFMSLIPFATELWSGVKTTEVCNYNMARHVANSIHARREMDLRNRWIEIIESWNFDPEFTQNDFFGNMWSPGECPDLDEDFLDHGIPRWLEQFPVGPQPFVEIKQKRKPDAKSMPRPGAASSSGGPVLRSASSSGGAVPPGTAPGAGNDRHQEDQSNVDFGSDAVKSLLRTAGIDNDNRWVLSQAPAGLKFTEWMRTTFDGTQVQGEYLEGSLGHSIPFTVLFPVPRNEAEVNNWEKYLRKITTLMLAWVEPQDFQLTFRNFHKKDFAAWLKLYAYLCARSQVLETELYPGARHLKALVRAANNPSKGLVTASKIIPPDTRNDNRHDIGPVSRVAGALIMLEWPFIGKSAKGASYYFIWSPRCRSGDGPMSRSIRSRRITCSTATRARPLWLMLNRLVRILQARAPRDTSCT